MRRVLALWVGLLSLTAVADTFETFGYGPRAAAMGGAMTADANDYTGVYYNPALLPYHKDVNFGFNFQWNRMNATVQQNDLARDIDCTYCAAQDQVGFSLGLLFPLGGRVRNRVAIAIGLYAPETRLLRVLAPARDQPFWLNYNSSPERLVLNVSAGIKIVDQVSIGIGVQALADLVGKGADVSVDLFNKQITNATLDSHLATRISPVLGLAIKPMPWLRFGATYRGEMALLYQIPASVNLIGVGTLQFNITGTTLYSPHTIQFGAAVDVLPELTLSLDGEWQKWSDMPTPYTNLHIGLNGEVLKGLGLDKAFDINSPDQPPGLKDTFNVRFGAEYRITERVAARLGGFYKPTPVPKQDTQGTNILDCDAVGVAAGMGFAVDDPLEIFQAPVHIDLAAQGQFLLGREAKKDDTDSVPSYKYSATVYGLTASVRYDF